MPRKQSVTKDMLLDAAFELVREKGGTEAARRDEDGGGWGALRAKEEVRRKEEGGWCGE